MMRSFINRNGLVRVIPRLRPTIYSCLANSGTLHCVFHPVTSSIYENSRYFSTGNKSDFVAPVSCFGCGSHFQFKYPDMPGYVELDRYKAYVDANEKKHDMFDDDDETLESKDSDGNDNQDSILEVFDEEATTLLEQLNKRNISEETRNKLLRELSLISPSKNFWKNIPTMGSLRQQKRKAWSKKNIRCVRCYQLKHYGATKGNVLAVSDENFRAVLKQRFQKDNRVFVIIKVVDLFDFDGSFIKEFRDMVDDRHIVLLAVNKLDMFPPPFSPQLNRLRHWIKQRTEEHGLRVHSIHPISATKGTGIRSLVTAAAELAEKVEGEGRREIYLIGNTNVGKSSIINAMMKKHLIRRSGTYKEVHEDGTMTMTESLMPGTTLGVVAFPLVPYRLGTLFDTPGIVNFGQLGVRLTRDELKHVIPATVVTPHTYRVKPGRSLLLGGFCQIELLSDKDFFFTSFVSQKMIVHVTKSEGVKEFLERNTGTIMTPPFNVERGKEVGTLSAYNVPEGTPIGVEYKLMGAGWLESACDIVIPGIGWVAVTGSGLAHVRVIAPPGIDIFIRKPLMPFEARTTTFKNYGNPLRIKPSHKAQVRRLERGKMKMLRNKGLPQKKAIRPKTQRAARKQLRKSHDDDLY